jgi:hypothetical protein
MMEHAKTGQQLAMPDVVEFLIDRVFASICSWKTSRAYGAAKPS